MATTAQPVEGRTIEQQVLEIVRELLLEQGKERAAANLTLQSSFQRDLGLASLDLVELLIRCESRFEIEIPENIAEQADTVAGWVRAIQQGGQDSSTEPVYRIVPPTRPAPPPPAHAQTIAEVLSWHAAADPGRIHAHFIEGNSGEGVTIGQLYDASLKVARGLIAVGLKREETVALLLPNSRDFLEAFFGIVLAGCIPVPIYPPSPKENLGEYVDRQIRILRNAGVRFLIAFDRIEQLARILRVNLNTLLDVCDTPTLRYFGARGAGRLPTPASTALIQYTSGSTGDPKGVVLSHDNLLANMRAIGQAVGVRPDDAVVSWLPLQSDMGLVGCWLFSLYYGLPLTQLSPLEFLRRPESWFWAIHNSRGTLSAGPNFAWELCVRRIPAWTLEGIDLSCWRVAVNAGEMVLPSTIRGFIERFRWTGFRPEAVTPAYGLAEATVALSIPEIGRGLFVDRVRRADIESRGSAVKAPEAEADAIEFVGSGRPVEAMQVRVVDDTGRPLPDRVVGRLQFRGASCCLGYFSDPDSRPATRDDGWMDSGDLAYLVDGEIFITGRWKDIIIRAGRKLFPSDIEAAASQAPGLLRGSVCAIGVPDSRSGTERLVIVAESEAEGESERRRVERGIREKVTAAIGEPPDQVVLLAPGCLAKTANGKLRRSAVKSFYLDSRLPERPTSQGRQYAALWLANLDSLAVLAARRGASLLKRAGLEACAKLAARDADKDTISSASSRVLSILGLKVTCENPAWAGVSGGRLIVANRIAELDPLAIASVLNGTLSFAGPEACLGAPDWVRRFLEPCILRSKEAIAAALENGELVVLLPDGAIGEPASRCRFRLPALHAAIRVGATVIPVAIREVQRQTFISAAEPIPPAGHSAVELRTQIRSAIDRVYD
jgi:acyl carrier protein